MPKGHKAPRPPVLTVTAVLTIVPTADGGGDVTVKVDAEGTDPLVGQINRSIPHLRMVGEHLRAVVLRAIGTDLDAPPVDVLAQRARAGRA